jgi:cell division protein FtsL
MKTRIAVTLMLAAFATIVFAQAEKIKGKAKDLKRNIEAQQTNNATIKTNTPAKPR